MGDLMSGFTDLLGKGVTGFGNMFSGLLGGTEAAGQNQFFAAGKDGAMGSVNAASAGAFQGFKDGKLTEWGQQNLTADQISSGMSSMKDGSTFDINAMANNAAKLGNLGATWQNQKMQKQYFDEWKKNNAYMKEEAESQKKGRQHLAAELSGSSTNVA